jgi:MoxR-like ATPase
LLVSGGVDSQLSELQPVLSGADLVEIQDRAGEVMVADQLTDYVLSIVEATRNSGEFALGASTRAAQDLFRATQATALCEGRMYAIPDDVQTVATAVLGHRVVMRQGSGLKAGRQAIEHLLSEMAVPL